jgi:hypothetical protein
MKMRRTIRTASAFIAALAGSSAAWACPLCESETGRRVRAGLLGADFGYNLVATLLPFPVFLGIIAWIHFGFPRAGPGPGPSTSRDLDDAPSPLTPNTEGRS